MFDFISRQGPQNYIWTQYRPTFVEETWDAEQTYLGEKIEGHRQADFWPFSSLVKNKTEVLQKANRTQKTTSPQFRPEVHPLPHWATQKPALRPAFPKNRAPQSCLGG